MKTLKFKIGDKVITTLGHIGTIINIKDNKYEVFFKTDSALIHEKRLKLYNNMNKIEYYKTYNIAYKLPNNNYANYKKAWPSCNDNGEIIWTLCEDNYTIISNKYVIDYKLL